MTTVRIFVASILALTTTVHADTFGSGANTFSMTFVPIGDAGNPNDVILPGNTDAYGGVPYAYRMAVTDVSRTMITLATANGVPNLGGGGPWSGNQPAAGVTWYQAAAFVNFLNTSTGHAPAYQLDPANTTLTLWNAGQAWSAGGQNLFRNKDAFYFLPNENEWYKAAFYDPNKGGPGVGGYWLYATGSNTVPAAVASGTDPNTAVYGQPTAQGPAPVDQSGGLSPYGTRGQTGNLYHWLDTEFDGLNDDPSGFRTVRGGKWNAGAISVESADRNGNGPALVTNGIGFRVASVPEPSCMLLMASAGIVALCKRRRRAGL